MKTIIWRRASEIYGNNAAIFKGIRSEDIKQGMLGDSYFLQALAGLANFKEDFHVR